DEERRRRRGRTDAAEPAPERATKVEDPEVQACLRFDEDRLPVRPGRHARTTLNTETADTLPSGSRSLRDVPRAAATADRTALKLRETIRPTNRSMRGTAACRAR